MAASWLIASMLCLTNMHAQRASLLVAAAVSACCCWALKPNQAALQHQQQQQTLGSRRQSGANHHCQDPPCKRPQPAQCPRLWQLFAPGCKPRQAAWAAGCHLSLQMLQQGPISSQHRQTRP